MLNLASANGLGAATLWDNGQHRQAVNPLRVTSWSVFSFAQLFWAYSEHFQLQIVLLQWLNYFRLATAFEWEL